MFFGAAGYAVYNGVTEREAQDQADEQICDAVNGLRRDFVEIIQDQKDRGIANAKKLGLDVEQIKKDYENTLNKIGDEECP